MKVELKLSTFGLWDVVINGETVEREIPLIMAQAAAYCFEHEVERGWTVADTVNCVHGETNWGPDVGKEGIV